MAHMKHAARRAFRTHDHGRCRNGVLMAAERMACSGAVRLTPVRRRVLELLLENHRAMGAYEILERLAAEGWGRQPPLAYRALNFLVEQGLAHKVERLNAYMACMHPPHAHPPVLLICHGCRRVAEVRGETVTDAVAAAARPLGFRAARVSVEALGLCPRCHAQEVQEQEDCGQDIRRQRDRDRGHPPCSR